jgi:hypothetical protein
VGVSMVTKFWKTYEPLEPPELVGILLEHLILNSKLLEGYWNENGIPVRFKLNLSEFSLI